MFTGLEHEKKKDEAQVPRRNEMQSLCCTARGLKNLILQKVVKQ